MDGADGHAVVVDASMAGLLAARACSDHFAHVTLIDRDAPGDSSQPRRGVPQARLLHVLLPGGLRTIDRLLPGYSAELEAARAVPVRAPADGLMLLPGGWVDRRAGADDGGVTVRPLDGPAGARRELPADLVVDPSRRGSRTPTWLESPGCPAVPETRVDPDIAYASRVYRMPAGFSTDWQLLMLFSQPPSMPRTRYLFPSRTASGWSRCAQRANRAHRCGRRQAAGVRGWPSLPAP